MLHPKEVHLFSSGFFFVFDVDHFFLSLYWICYNIASVLCFWFFWPQAMCDLSSPTRDQTHTPCIGRWNLNHWTVREVPRSTFLMNSFVHCLDHMSGTNTVANEKCRNKFSHEQGWLHSIFIVTPGYNSPTAKSILQMVSLMFRSSKKCLRGTNHWQPEEGDDSPCLAPSHLFTETHL